MDTPAVSSLAQRADSRQKVARLALLWETLQREKAEAEALNLDRATFLVDCLLRLESVG